MNLSSYHLRHKILNLPKKIMILLNIKVVIRKLLKIWNFFNINNN